MFALIAFPVVALYKGDFDHNANVYVATLNATALKAETRARLEFEEEFKRTWSENVNDYLRSVEEVRREMESIAADKNKISMEGLLKLEEKMSDIQEGINIQTPYVIL
uniref:Rod shape-determining protein MreC n=1 Tax=Ascaris lumbricoides TaxID=6252 RepID=A0A0M3HQ14_ASCLU